MYLNVDSLIMIYIIILLLNLYIFNLILKIESNNYCYL